MIYYVYNKFVQEHMGYAEVHTRSELGNHTVAAFQDMINADFVFELTDGKVRYLKNRMASANHFSEEDIVALKLKAIQK